MPVPNIRNGGAVQMTETFPQFLYHPSLSGHRRVNTVEEKVEADREGWKEGYREQEYPRMMHHIVPELSTVANSEEEVEEMLKKGYALSPTDFTEEKALEAKIAMAKTELEEMLKKDKLLKQQMKAKA